MGIERTKKGRVCPQCRSSVQLEILTDSWWHCLSCKIGGRIIKKWRGEILVIVKREKIGVMPKRKTTSEKPVFKVKLK
ncbi:hypothetical protein ES707_12300 [subsurface metagenome]